MTASCLPVIREGGCTSPMPPGKGRHKAGFRCFSFAGQNKSNEDSAERFNGETTACARSAAPLNRASLFAPMGQSSLSFLLMLRISYGQKGHNSVMPFSPADKAMQKNISALPKGESGNSKVSFSPEGRRINRHTGCRRPVFLPAWRVPLSFLPRGLPSLSSPDTAAAKHWGKQPLPRAPCGYAPF